MKIDISQLQKHFFTISQIFAERQTGDGKTRFTMQNPRPTDAFLLFVSTNGVCYREGEEPLYVPKGSLVYIPKNSRYVWENSPSEENGIQVNLLFEFILESVETNVLSEGKKVVDCSDKKGERISFSDSVCIRSGGKSKCYCVVQTYKKIFLLHFNR